MTTFPPELVEAIVYAVWHSEMSSYIRTSFMTTCPSSKKSWVLDLEGNYEDKILTNFYKQLKSAKNMLYTPYGRLSAMQDRVSTYPIDKVAGLAFFLGACSIPAYNESQSLEDAWTTLINEMDSYHRGVLFFTYPEPGAGCNKWRPSWEQVMTESLPHHEYDRAAYVERDDDDWCEGLHIERGFVHGLAEGGEEGMDRCGELVVEDAHGIAHTFGILASHQYPIPEDTYTLLGSDPYYRGEMHMCLPQYWVIGRRLPSKKFEKVSVFNVPYRDDIWQLNRLEIAAKSRSILA